MDFLLGPTRAIRAASPPLVLGYLSTFESRMLDRGYRQELCRPRQGAGK